MENLENINHLIVPDVHGRTFWEEPVKEVLEKTNAKIVFLGDYLDPYGYEGITSKDAIMVFKEIIELKKLYKDRIILLIGNHDVCYIGETESGGRYDKWNAPEIRDLFMNNWDLFEFIYFDEVAGKKYLFSHAGFNPEWLDIRREFLGIKDDEPFLDFVIGYDWKLNFFKDQMRLVSYLEDVSSWRWGPARASSFVWCDVNEHLFEHKHLEGCVQIFGHTQQAKVPVREKDNLYCLDVRRCFILDNDGVVRELDGSELEDNSDAIMEKEMKNAENAMAFLF